MKHVIQREQLVIMNIWIDWNTDLCYVEER